MRAIGYTRCSTNEQADSGLGLDAQAERVRAYCTLKGLRLVETITDAGVSGGKPLAGRDGGRALLDALKRKRADAVVMLKLDRMFRNAGDCLTTVEKWERQGVSLHIADLGGNAIDTTSAAGRFMLVVLAGAAEMERNLTRERTRSAMAVKRANGQRIGTVPYGSDLAGDGAMLVPNDAEQTVHRRYPGDAGAWDEAPRDCRFVDRPSNSDEDGTVKPLDASGRRADSQTRAVKTRFRRGSCPSTWRACACYDGTCARSVRS